VNGVIPQRERVAQVLERKRVLGETLLSGEARDMAERDHQMVVCELELARADAGGQGDAPALEVDRLDRARVEIRARAHRRRMGAMVSRMPMLPGTTSGSMGWNVR